MGRGEVGQSQQVGGKKGSEHSHRGVMVPGHGPTFPRLVSLTHHVVICLSEEVSVGCLPRAGRCALASGIKDELDISPALEKLMIY